MSLGIAIIDNDEKLELPAACPRFLVQGGLIACASV